MSNSENSESKNQQKPQDPVVKTKPIKPDVVYLKENFTINSSNKKTENLKE